MGQFVNLNGLRFNRLVVERKLNERSSNGGVQWECQCDCGGKVVSSSDSLRRGNTQSCGCLRLEKITLHGMRNAPEYRCWSSMKSRCSNPRHRGFKDYGGRGISVCDRWQVFENFLADMGPRPSDGHSIDRYPNNDGNYEPENCRWATAKQQIDNRRRPKQKRIVHIRGLEFRTVSDAAAHFCVTPGAVRHWIKGQPGAQAKEDCYVRNI